MRTEWTTGLQNLSRRCKTINHRFYQLMNKSVGMLWVEVTLRQQSLTQLRRTKSCVKTFFQTTPAHPTPKIKKKTFECNIVRNRRQNRIRVTLKPKIKKVKLFWKYIIRSYVQSTPLNNFLFSAPPPFFHTHIHICKPQRDTSYFFPSFDI